MKFNHKKGKKNITQGYIKYLPFPLAWLWFPSPGLQQGLNGKTVKPYALEEVGTVNTSLNLLSEQPW